MVNSFFLFYFFYVLQAAARGDVDRIAWCMAHKGEVNWSDPEEGGGRTSLHAACEADRRRAAVVLLLNGANMCDLTLL